MRRVVLPLFALAVLLPSLAFARAQFVCRVDLVVRDSCCCPPKKATPPIDAPSVKPECCAIETHSATPAPPVIAAASMDTLAAPIATRIATTIVVPPLRELGSVIEPRAQAPPLERSLFSQHCALLV